MKFRASKPFLFAITVLLSLFYSHTCQAQDYYNDDSLIRDTANAFCKQLARVMKQTKTDYAQAKGTLLDSSGQKAWDCKDYYRLDGARSCTILQHDFSVEYAAIFLSRDSKDGLEASYHNLCHAIKDCLGQYYIYKEKKTSPTDMLLGTKDFEYEIRPYGDMVPEQCLLIISVQPDGQNGGYSLVLEIRKYRGYY